MKVKCAPQPGFSAISMVFTLIVVLVVTLAVVRVTWGLAGSTGSTSKVTTPEGVTATLPSEGAPVEVAADVVLTTHAAAIMSEARTAAMASGVTVAELAPSDYLGRYPVEDGDRTITAELAPGATPQVEISATGKGVSATRCLDLNTGSSSEGAC